MVAIERRPGLHVVPDVGDVDADLEFPVVVLAHADGVVEVLRVGAVDGEDPATAQVFAVNEVRRTRILRSRAPTCRSRCSRTGRTGAL